MKRFTSLLIVVSLLLSTPSALVYAQKKAKPEPRASEKVTLSFANAEIAEVARTIGVITGRSVVVDPRVRGTMNLNTDQPVSKAAAYDQFLAALRLQGFTVVEASGLSKVVPEADAKLQGGSVSTSSIRGPGNQIATQIFRLNYETANNLVPVLRPLISPNNTINVNPGNNSLIITDYTDNLQRMARIVAALDVPNASDTEIIVLKHAIASDIVPMVIRLLDSGAATAAGQGQTDSSFKTTILAEPRSNAVIVRAGNPARTALARALVERLDQPGGESGAGNGNIHVVYLKNADATRLAATLRAAISGGAGGSTGGAGGAVQAGLSGLSNTSAPGGAQPLGGAAGAGGAGGATGSFATSSQSSTGGQIQADTSVNALIISAPEPQYRQLRAVIDLLDARRAQVFVESLIAEVNADKAAEFGIQWQGALGKKGDGTVGLLGTNFGSGGSNIISLATSAANGTLTTPPSPGLNFGLVNRIGGVYVLGALARFLETSGDGNILSTPNLLTLDNEEAKIVIGQNVPFVTGQFTNTGGGNNGAVNPFQTIERKDVGLTLRVKPQISENGTVRLQVFQEISSVQANSVNSPSGLITNKRSFETNVLVDDGAIVVLGGLLQDEYAGNQDKVPLVGDIPLFGNLFKSETRSRKKTNLMVFLRPVVVRDAQKSDELSMDRYDLMRGLQQNTQPAQSAVFPVNTAPVLPPPTRGMPTAPAEVQLPPKAPPPAPAAPTTSTTPGAPPWMAPDTSR
jgi:general secretion pathway protein D